MTTHTTILRGLGIILALCMTAGIFSACTNDVVEQEHMIISPTTLVFQPTDTTKLLSITHSCTCPFTWSSSFSDSAQWLNFPDAMQGDHTNISIAVDRTKLTTDSAHTWVRIQSNSYGRDSISVTIYK